MHSDQTAAPSRVTLPPSPAPIAQGTVSAWVEPIMIDSYLPEEPDRYPNYFETRVYQGSSGRVFPLPFHERISANKVAHRWQAVHLENEWLRLVILPEIGGRIYIAHDKVGEYDIFYRNNVIKPALVGLAGPWVSGGVEFNWPQHHRPATFLPTDFTIERDDDGSVTVWCSDHDPFARMKGMHGIRLRPDSSKIEARVRLYNRNECRQTFLWWANVAAAVNDDYQSFFPDDVSWVADHAKRAVVSFPKARGTYYGVDYPASAAERPGADRLDWYSNIPVPTSYMAVGSAADFFGGYDHGRAAGFIHWAPREISPGKKQWTWGNAPFGWAWDRNLTDDDGPYVELMAGVYTDNQPDFAYLAPGETKTFSQFWYPISAIGPAHAATADVAGSFEVAEGVASIGIISSEHYAVAEIRIRTRLGSIITVDSIALAPATPFIATREGVQPGDVLEVIADGRLVLVVLSEKRSAEDDEPAAASEPGLPADITSIDELVQVAVYLEQYRHATRSSVPYWQEVLSRDPGESRAHLALGALAYQRADYEAALSHVESVLGRAAKWTPTPRSGEAHYQAGLTLVRLGRDDEAAERFARAGWDVAYAAAAGFALAKLQCRGGDHDRAEMTLNALLETDPRHLQAADLLATILLMRGETERAGRIIDQTVAIDPLDSWARHLSGRKPTADATIALDIALDYQGAGFSASALDMLHLAQQLNETRAVGQVNSGPIIAYHQAAILEASGDHASALVAWHRAGQSDARNALPSRLDDIDALVVAIEHGMGGALAHAMLGHWQYARGRYTDAQRAWTTALKQGLIAPEAAIAHRNLGLAAYNVDQDPGAAAAQYDQAMQFLPSDSKLLFESDQLDSRRGVSAQGRITRLERHPDALAERDDLLVAYVNSLIEVGRLNEARRRLAERFFQPWEGGEGQVIAAWDSVCLGLARHALERGDIDDADALVGETVDPPESLGEGRHPLANVSHIELLRGDVAAAAGQPAVADAHWEAAARSVADFSNMALTPFSSQTMHSIAALRRLGREAQAETLIDAMDTWLTQRAAARAGIDFFATSLPTMLLFVDDPATELAKEVTMLRAQLDEMREVRLVRDELQSAE